METNENESPARSMLRGDEELASFSFRLPQGPMREMIAIDPSRPHLAAALDRMASNFIVEHYRRLHDAGVSQVIWETDIPPGPTILLKSIPSPRDPEVKQRLWESGLASSYELIDKDLNFIAQQLDGGPGFKSINMWMMGEDGNEIRYTPAKHGARLFSDFLTMNLSPIARLGTVFGRINSEGIGVSAASRLAGDALTQRDKELVEDFRALLCVCPGVEISFLELAKRLGDFSATREEYNREWDFAAWEWE